jgi:hypothetical protein
MSDNLIPLVDLIDGLDDDYLAPGPYDDDADREEPLPGEVAAVNWRTLTDDDAPAVWAALGEWVDWFVTRYQLSTRRIPACWYRHGDLVEELSALHTAWEASYSPLDGGYGPIGWHERLTVSLQRLAAAYPAECTDGHSEPLHFPVAAVTGTDGFRDWARTNHT